jgi:hypothetical protein
VKLDGAQACHIAAYCPILAAIKTRLDDGAKLKLPFPIPSVAFTARPISKRARLRTHAPNCSALAHVGLKSTQFVKR